METIFTKTLIFLMFTSTIIAEIHHKRSPHGFQGVRGKREIETNNLQTNYSSTTTEDEEDQISKSIEKSIDSAGIFEQSSPVAIVKRAPVGFMGMRGKKDYEYTDFKNNALFMNDDENRFVGNGDGGADGGDVGFVKYPFDRFVPKRAPSGFMGMRGKKLIDNDLNNNNNNGAIKRIPSGFMGMRGKKFNSIFMDETLLNNNHNYNNDDLLLEKQINMDQKILSDILKFYGLQQNNNLNTNLLPNNNNNNNNNHNNHNNHNNNDNDNDNSQATFLDSYEKRIPSSAGFFGMRGKKLSNDDNSISISDDYDFNSINNDNDFDKRAPSSGFFGMRGKKWSDDDENEQHFITDNNMIDDNEKRAPSMGFMGMRGKKDVTNVLLNEEKRIPSSGFFGMRGKKIPTGFFGMRGKKGPYEFRGKFVGVRGKKAMNPLRKLAMDLNELQHHQQSDNMQSSAVNFGSPDFQSNKRGGKPSGFVGMRGKKWTDSDEQKYK